MLNAVFCGLLFVTVAYIGNLFARQVEQRPKALADMRTALDTLRTRLRFYNEPLRAALEGTATELHGDFAQIFRLAAELMAKGECAEDALRDAMHESKQRGGVASSLQGQDIEALLALARRMGGDAASQNAAFGMAFATLDGTHKQAEQNKQSHGRLYRTAGLLAGALLAIIFI